MYLYLRQGISMIISFFATRVTLDILGVTDYGISAAVGGAVSMITFLTGALSVGNLRFFSFYLGNGDKEKLKKIFAGTLAIYLSMIIVFVLFCETFGLWLLNTQMVIPEERMHAAMVIYQLAVVGMCLGLVSPPYHALITAHEDMKIYAQMTVVDQTLRLVTLYLLWVLPFDKLILFSLIGLIISFGIQIIYLVYCWKRYPECHTLPKFEKPIIKELLGFNVWNLCGNFAWMLKNQGTAVLLNMFFGPVVNAAQNIANSIRGVSMTFAGGFTSAVKPQITMNYASGDYNHMFSLTYGGAKITYILMAIIIFPLLFNVELVLNLWLHDVPQYAVIFCQLMLIELLIDQIGYMISTVVQATGKIRNYQLLVGLFGALNIPVSYVALKFGASPEWVFVISIFMQIGVNAMRVIYLKLVRKSAVMECMKSCIFPCTIAALVSVAFCYIMPRYETLLPSIPVIVVEVVVVLIAGYYLALNANEKNLLMSYVNKFKAKIFPQRQSA